MCVLKLTLRKIIFLQIFLQFLFFSVKCPDGLSLRQDGYGSDGRTVSPCVQTGVAQTGEWSGDTSGQAWPIACLCCNARLDELVICPDGDPTGYMSRIQP
jgi:hypothetical protein